MFVVSCPFMHLFCLPIINIRVSVNFASKMLTLLALQLSVAAAFNPSDIATPRLVMNSAEALRPRTALPFAARMQPSDLQVIEILLDANNMGLDLQEHPTGLPFIYHNYLPEGFDKLARALSPSLPMTAIFDGNGYSSMLSNKEWVCDCGESTEYRIRFTKSGKTADDALVEYITDASEGTPPAKRIRAHEALALLQSPELAQTVVTVERHAYSSAQQAAREFQELTAFFEECGLPKIRDVIHLPSFTEPQRVESLELLQKIVSQSNYFKFARLDLPARLVVTDDLKLRQRLAGDPVLILNTKQFYSWAQSFPGMHIDPSLQPSTWNRSWKQSSKVNRMVNAIHSHLQNVTTDSAQTGPMPSQLSKVFLDASNMQNLHEASSDHLIGPPSISTLGCDVLLQLVRAFGHSLSITAVFDGNASHSNFSGKQWTCEDDESRRCHVLFTDAGTSREDVLVDQLATAAEGSPAPSSISVQEAVELLEKSDLPRPTVVVQRHFGKSKRKKQEKFYNASSLTEEGDVAHFPSFTEAQRLRSLEKIRQLSNYYSRRNNFTFAQLDTPTSLLVTDKQSIRHRIQAMNLPVVVLGRHQLMYWIREILVD